MNDISHSVDYKAGDDALVDETLAALHAEFEDQSTDAGKATNVAQLHREAHADLISIDTSNVALLEKLFSGMELSEAEQERLDDISKTAVPSMHDILGIIRDADANGDLSYDDTADNTIDVAEPQADDWYAKDTAMMEAFFAQKATAENLHLEKLEAEQARFNKMTAQLTDLHRWLATNAIVNAAFTTAIMYFIYKAG